MSKATIAGIVVSALASASHAAVVIGPSGIDYSQNFDTLTTSTTATPWVDNSTLPDWYAAYTTAATVEIASSAGGSGTGRLYSFGSINSVNGGADRALGSVASSTTGAIRYGIPFLNNTGTTITEFTVAYDGEQWRIATQTGAGTNPGNQQIVFAYQIVQPGSGSLGNTGYTNVPTLNFNTPQDGPAATTGDQPIDGNLPANREHLSGTIPVEWEHGQELWIRFFDADSTGNDHGIAIDNFEFTVVVPEPATLGLLAMSGLLCVRRRRA